MNLKKVSGFRRATPSPGPPRWKRRPGSRGGGNPRNDSQFLRTPGHVERPGPALEVDPPAGVCWSAQAAPGLVGAPRSQLSSPGTPPSASANARNSGQQRLSRAGPRAGAPQQPRAGLAWEGRGARGRSWPGAGAGMQPLLTAVNSPPLGPPSRGWRSTELKSICDRVRRRGDGPGDELGWGRRM